MFKEFSKNTLFILFYDILLFLTVLLFGLIISESVLPGLTASFIRVFDVIILLCGAIFLLSILSQKIHLSETSFTTPVHSIRIITGSCILISIGAFLSASYKYNIVEIIILFLFLIPIYRFFYLTLLRSDA